MDIEVARNGGLDLVDELAELGGAMASVAFTDDLPGRDIERGKERCRAMASVVMAAPRRLAGPHRQRGLAAVGLLDL